MLHDGIEVSGSRSSHEERGLKFKRRVILTGTPGRSSHEERGLKYPHHGQGSHAGTVAPRMRSVD